MNRFGQLIIGPAGSGKTTYCHAVSKFLESIGRKVAIRLPYMSVLCLSETISFVQLSVRCCRGACDILMKDRMEKGFCLGLEPMP
jgi:predicted PilT family ATPase